jgi:hypothetical protein
MFSSETHPTVGRTLPVLEYLLVNWNNMSKLPKFAPVKSGLEKGIAKIEKWHKATSQTDIAFTCLGMWRLCITPSLYVRVLISLVLDPCIKTEYAKQSWDAPHYNQAMAKFEKTVCYGLFCLCRDSHTLC